MPNLHEEIMYEPKHVFLEWRHGNCICECKCVTSATIGLCKLTSVIFKVSSFMSALFIFISEDDLKSILIKVKVHVTCRKFENLITYQNWEFSMLKWFPSVHSSLLLCKIISQMLSRWQEFISSSAYSFTNLNLYGILTHGNPTPHSPPLSHPRRFGYNEL